MNLGEIHRLKIKKSHGGVVPPGKRELSRFMLIISVHVFTRNIYIHKVNKVTIVMSSLNKPVYFKVEKEES